eukprot:gene9531-biopygen8591
MHTNGTTPHRTAHVSDAEWIGKCRTKKDVDELFPGIVSKVAAACGAAGGRNCLVAGLLRRVAQTAAEPSTDEGG